MYRIEIGNPITKPIKFQSTYVFEFRYMHGDADCYTIEEFRVSDAQKVSDLIHFWLSWKNLPWNHRCDLLSNDVRLETAIRDMELFNPDEIINWVFIGDVTYDGGLAHIMSLTISWYDKSGIKHTTKVLDDNNQLINLA